MNSDSSNFGNPNSKCEKFFIGFYLSEQISSSLSPVWIYGFYKGFFTFVGQITNNLNTKLL